MCGIAGFINHKLSESSAVTVLTAMLEQIKHRGPDDQGVWFESGVSLGHRRLSIVDLSPLGHQPMISSSGRRVIVFNGEIYNHATLRGELQSLGVAFRGNSDTEVLLALIERVGLVEALKRCVGMFALAIWDRNRGVLQLARDRFGEKPLYYGWAGQALLFGSELKALLAYGGVDHQVEARAVRDVLTTGHVRAPLSIFKALRQVEAGSVIEFSFHASHKGSHPLSDRSINIIRYWSATHALHSGLASPFTGTFEDAVDAVTAGLREAVGIQMQADVGLGAFLSGGIDSSLVVALMQAQATQPVRTYSIGFNNDRLNEAAHAKAVAHYLDTQHTEWYVDESEALELVNSLSTYYDEPLADASQLPTLILAKLTRRDVKVALSGDGADEIFGGYPKYGRGHRVLHQPGRQLLGRCAGLLAGMVVPPLSRWLPGGISRHIPWHSIDAVAAVYGATSSRELADALSVVNRRPNEFLAPELAEDADLALHPLVDGQIASHLEYRRQAMLADSTDYLCNDILVKVDRATMAASLECRAPFLDHRIVEFAATLPEAYLFNGLTGKHVLRAALRRLVPTELVDRPKAGFTPPLGHWLRGALKEWAYDTLATEAAARVVNTNRCRRLMDLHCSSRFDLSARLWPMLTLASWSSKWTQ